MSHPPPDIFHNHRPDLISTDFVSWAAAVALVAVLIGSFVISHLWRKRTERRSLLARQAEEAAVARERQERLTAQLEEAHQIQMQHVTAQLENLATRIGEIFQRRQQLRQYRERMREMTQTSRTVRHEMKQHSRRKWPVVAGQRARNDQYDREWKASRKDPGTERARKLLVSIGKYQLLRLSK